MTKERDNVDQNNTNMIVAHKLDRKMNYSNNDFPLKI